MNRSNTKRVAVVGAGPCGLVATKTLLAAGHEVVCYEASDTVGGHWKIDNKSGKSAAYESLTTNTNKHMSRLRDYQMPEDWPDLPSHALMYDWWCGYVDQFSLLDALSLQREVKQIQPTSSGWRLQAEHAGVVEWFDFDAVVAASGNYWDLKLPAFVAQYSGAWIHAQQYRSPTRPLDLAGKKVLVVGSGNTGCEIALELSREASIDVHLGARSGNWILPKYLDGPDGPVHIAAKSPLSHPLDSVPKLIRVLPENVRDGLFNRIAKRVFAKQFGEYAQRLTDAGMPPPPDNPLEKRPAVADGLAEALEAREITARPGVEGAEGKLVRFSNGRSDEFDVIICATGFHLTYPYIDQSILDTSNDDMHLFRGLMHPQYHSLFVVGVSRPTGGFWPIAEAQAEFIGALLGGRYRLPSQTQIEAATQPVLKRDSFNPALYGLALRQELAKRY
ncbi:MAG: FAD-dependent oxidoreductase [Pseudomonadota bacterium]